MAKEDGSPEPAGCAVTVDGDIVRMADGAGRHFTSPRIDAPEGAVRAGVAPESVRVIALADPHPSSHRLSEKQVEAALSDDDDPVAHEVRRLVDWYNIRLADLERLGQPPLDVLEAIRPRWPIEAVALRLMTDIVRRFPEPLA